MIVDVNKLKGKYKAETHTENHGDDWCEMWIQGEILWMLKNWEANGGERETKKQTFGDALQCSTTEFFEMNKITPITKL